MPSPSHAIDFPTMNPNLLPASLLGSLLFAAPLLAQETPPDAPRIIGPISDGSPSAPVEKAPLPVAPVEKTVVHQDNGRSITFQKIQQPDLPSPAAQSVAPANGESSNSVPELPQVSERPGMFMLSATVYGHQKTLLRWWHEGEEFVAWSTVDFNYLGGFAAYEAKGAQYNFIMALGDSPLTDALDAPVLPTNGPAFVLVKGDADNAAALAPITGLHDLYKVEAPRLIAATLERQRHQAEREAYLKAHPPQPKNTTTKFWKRVKPVTQPAQEGGAQ